MISGFQAEVGKQYGLLGYYAASSGNFLPTFRNNISVPSSGFQNKKLSLSAQYGVRIGKSVGGEKTE